MTAWRSGDVFIHGITPRSGTNFLARVLECHDDLSKNPHRVWELPHLRNAVPLLDYAAGMSHSPKMPGLEPETLLPYLGKGLLEYLVEGIPTQCRLVVKEPSVENITQFFAFFPRSNLVILIRDGRDVACSALRTKFAAPPRLQLLHPRTWRLAFRHPLNVLAEQWTNSSRTIREFLEEIRESEFSERVRVVRYEDVVRDQEGEIERILAFLNLDAERYDWNRLGNLRVRGSSFLANDRELVRTEFNPIGRWREWSQRQREAYLSIAEEELQHWGYLEE